MKYLRMIATACLIAMLASCAAPVSPEDAASDTPETTTAVTEDPNLRKNAKDNLPADLKFDGATFAWLCQTEGDLTWDLSGGGEESADVVLQTVFERNRSVEERLGITLKLEQNGTDSGWKDYRDLVKNAISADACPWDIILIRGNASIQSKLNSYFHTVENNKYIDLEQPWWWDGIMKDLSIDGKHLRYMLGDILLDNINSCRVAYFNKRILESIGENENALYQMAIDGKWTLDAMAELTTKAYADLDGDGKLSSGDQLGIYTGGSGDLLGLNFAHAVRTYTRDDKNYPRPDLDMERAQSSLEAQLKFLYETTGVWNTISQGKWENHDTVFASGQILFILNQFADAFGETYRNMEDAYGFLPVPKLTEDQMEYRTLVSNGSNLLVIPRTNDRPDDTGAVLEALAAESYRTVIDPYFETALKTRYTHDALSVQCIDIIYSTLYRDFLSEYDPSNCGQMVTNLVKKNANTLASSYTAALEKSNSRLDGIYQDFEANLPK